MKSTVSLSVLGAAALVIAAASTQATVTSFAASLSGPAEDPANASPGIGTALVDYDDVAHSLRVQITFSGLLGTTTASHIHAATLLPGTGLAGVATQTPSFTGFPLGVTAGSMDNTFDLTQTSSFRAAFVAANGGTAAGAEAALVASMNAGTAYCNIHTSLFQSGEIRGFLGVVPAPSSAVVLALAGVVGARRRRA